VAFAAGSGLARPKNAGNFRKNGNSSLKPGAGLGIEDICSPQLLVKISAVLAVVSVLLLILNLLL
jgi:hypothetical protein